MSEQNNSNQNNSGNKPDFIAYNVTQSNDGKGHWNKVGAAWQHQDGQGYDLALDSIPVDGRVTLRELREERIQSYDNQRQNQEPENTRDQSHNRNRSRGRG